MMRRIVIAAILSAALVLPAGAQDRASPPKPLAVFDPLIGKTWRGTSTAPGSTDIDVQRYEQILGGKGVRVTHSVNNGAYGGETIIQADRTGRIVYHYFTTAGFSTQGSMTVRADGALVAEEAVQGHATIRRVRSTLEFLPDGSLRSQSSYQTDAGWQTGHGFHYRIADPSELRWAAPR